MLDNDGKGGGTLEHDRHEIIVEEITPSYGRIVLEPLERGYGITLGNALRRVLLSSIPGASISAVRIEGVLHEFSTVPGVREDVIELLVNLKHVPLRCYNAELKTLHLEVEGPKTVTAADIQPDADVEYVDPEAVICTLEAGHRISMDLYVEQGIGYAAIDRPRPAYLPVDALLIDAVFSPAKRVKYEVQDVRMGQRTDYDRLVLEVWTNGVVTPKEAVAKASAILEGYFRSLTNVLSSRPSQGGALPEDAISPEGEGVPAEGDPAEEPVRFFENALLARPVRDLELSVRSENCLLRGGVHVIGDLVGRAREDLLKIRNLGKISLKEIEEKLEKFGLSLGGKPLSDLGETEDDLPETKEEETR